MGCFLISYIVCFHRFDEGDCLDGAGHVGERKGQLIILLVPERLEKKFAAKRTAGIHQAAKLVVCKIAPSHPSRVFSWLWMNSECYFRA